MKIAYVGYDVFLTAFKMTLACKCEVMKLFTFPVDGLTETNEKMKDVCRKNNIPWTEERITLDDLQALKDNGCELLIISGYPHKIPVLEGLRAVNIHPSPLPIGAGPWPWPVSILKDLPYSGVTIHVLTEELDAGDILIQRCYRLTKDMTARDMEVTFDRLSAELLRQLLAAPDAFFAQAMPQPVGGGEYWPEPSEEEKIFSYTDPYEKIDRIVRAFYGYGCTMKLPLGQVKILCARAMTAPVAAKPGEWIDEHHIAIPGGMLEIELSGEGLI